MEAQLHLIKTKGIPKPNAYVQALTGDLSTWALDEERAPLMKGKWREQFGVVAEHPLDLEIGTGNGLHFAHYVDINPHRCLVGIERKYKPLVQSTKRMLRQGRENGRMVRYHAGFLSHLFAEGELNNVFLHFPDPWSKKKQNKNRLVQKNFLENLFTLQKPNTFLDFKTDNQDYFNWSMKLFKDCPYKLDAFTYDLHNSEFKEQNFTTYFERIFLRQNLPIYWARLSR